MKQSHCNLYEYENYIEKSITCCITFQLKIITKNLKGFY